MINIIKEENWEVGDIILSEDRIYMICCNNGYFLIDLGSGYGMQPYDSLSELIDNCIEPNDLRVNLDCKISVGGTPQIPKPYRVSN